MHGSSSEALANEFTGQPFQALGVDVWDGSAFQVGIFRTQTGITYPTCLNGDAGGVRGDYHAESGEVFVIGGDGIIIFRGFFVEEDLRMVIEEGIAALPPVSATPDLAGPGHRFDGGYPNPFNPTTRLVFSIAPDVPAQPARLEILDLQGRVVRVLVDVVVSQGRDYQAVWNGRDSVGLPVASGVYMARLRVGAWQATRALTLVK